MTAAQEFKQLFDSPLRDQHIQVLASVFGQTMPGGDSFQLAGAGEVSAHA